MSIPTEVDGQGPERKTGRGDGRLAWISHVLPFALWILLITVSGNAAGWKYAVRTLLCGGLLLFLRPWRWYTPCSLRHIAYGAVAGVLVFLLWIFGESGLASALPAFQEGYAKFGILPWGREPAPPVTPPAYAPQVCGWALTVVRVLGSALVIAVIEEFFWRGCLYRALVHSRFLEVKLSHMHAGFFILVAVFFGLEHQRWLVGILTGLAYGGLMVRTGSIWPPVVAHAVTNLMLGIYVVATENYAFWS